jgi:3-hydroxyisobutyrate dehydrogenase-like beta-hydroxyacid dehydrogenase
VRYGDDPAAPALASGLVVMVMATVGPAPVPLGGAASRAERRDDRRAGSGGGARAGTGNLLIMVSGSELAVRRLRALLEAMASSVPVLGTRPGDSQKVRLVN